jgi:urease accessory protein UreF
MDIPLGQAQELALFQYTRSFLSAAVRLNILGPFLMHSLFCSLGTWVSSLASGLESGDLLEEPVQTFPLLEWTQTGHEQLYSRLFNS